MNRPIYLDNNATTPVDPRVVEAMMPWLTEKFGNAASPHAYGWEAQAAVELAQEQIATCLGASTPKSIFFTSGATESNNWALKVLMRASGKRPGHFITQKTEHKCILETAKYLEAAGHQVSILDVDKEGFVAPSAVEKAIRANTVLCSIMMANNEIGTLQPIREVAAICHQKGVLLHTDAAQAAGKIPVDVKILDVDLMSFSAHKIYGPKGIGGLYVAPRKPSIPLAAFIHGGGQQEGFRSGTLPVYAIVGITRAFEISAQMQHEEIQKLTALTDQLLQKLTATFPDLILNGPRQNRLPGNLNISIPGTKSTDIIRKIPSLALSSGSACASNSTEPSAVLQAITQDAARIEAALRIGIGRFNTAPEIATATELLTKTIKEIKESP